MPQIVIPFVTGAQSITKVRAQLPFTRSRVRCYLIEGGPVFGFFGREFATFADAQGDTDGAKGQPTYDFAAAGVGANMPWIDFAGDDDMVALVTEIATAGYLVFDECADRYPDRAHPHEQGRVVNR